MTITGISASVAATMTTLGISMEGVTTARTPQEALERYMNALRSQQDLPNNRAHMPLNH
ncbi:MAG: hypothetical protein HC822_02920 [Oscillochloris sp.]|nr:hypothetical protein [Oscillochloris sp.]